MSINLSGLWLGSFSYPAGQGPLTPFLASLEDNDGSLSGSIVEPNTIGNASEQLQAFVSGSRSGTAVDFTKMYDGEAERAGHVDDASDHHPVASAPRYVLAEPLVDLQIIERQRLQIGEARITGAEIVDSDPKPAFPKPGKQIGGGIQILD